MSSNCLASQTIDLTFLLSNKYLTPYAILDVPFVDIVADCKSMVVLYVLPDPTIELLTSNEPDIVTFCLNVLTNEAVDANEALNACVAYEAVDENEALNACVAYEAVPCNYPVNPP